MVLLWSSFFNWYLFLYGNWRQTLAHSSSSQQLMCLVSSHQTHERTGRSNQTHERTGRSKEDRYFLIMWNFICLGVSILCLHKKITKDPAGVSVFSYNGRMSFYFNRWDMRCNKTGIRLYVITVNSGSLYT